MAMNTIRVLVTGGNSGLGLATCKHFIEKGARVASLDIAQSCITDITPNLYLQADVTKENEIQTAMDRVRNEFNGGLDLLVNCAGVSCAYLTYNHNKKRMHSLEEFQRILNVNVTGTFNVIRLACSLLAKPQTKENADEVHEDSNSSLIVMTSSIAAFDGTIGQAAYSASKGAIRSMTLPLARELASVGIRVCTIAPGVMQTPLLNVASKKAIDVLSKITPFPKRLGKPEEYAMLVDSIYSNQFLNGTTVRIDGALRMQS
ncbi:hypothetical protein GJ496_003566 [Pomphorhynchus laevis]|nr:hypothetical protein GJ496_003566 [Pomphorhynchus laevis]